MLYANASQDSRKNPLDVNTKVSFMKKMFPKNNIKAWWHTENIYGDIKIFR